MNTGWIKIDRKIKNWQHYQEPSVMLVWIDILLSANAGERWHHGQKLRRGELRTSVATIAESTGLSANTVRCSLQKLSESGEISVTTTKKYTQIFVKQFVKYQGCAIIEQQTDEPIAQLNGEQVAQQTDEPIAHKQELKNTRININNPLTPLQGDAPVSKPETPRKGKPAARAVTRFDRIFEEIYFRKTNDTFAWTKRENIAVQSIVGKIVKMMEDAGKEPTDEDKENALRWYLESLYDTGDAWVQANFTPHIIDSKFNEFYQTIKIAKQNGKTKPANGTGVSADYLAKVAAELNG